MTKLKFLDEKANGTYLSFTDESGNMQGSVQTIGTNGVIYLYISIEGVGQQIYYIDPFCGKLGPAKCYTQEESIAFNKGIPLKDVGAWLASKTVVFEEAKK